MNHTESMETWWPMTDDGLSVYVSDRWQIKTCTNETKNYFSKLIEILAKSVHNNLCLPSPMALNLG